MPKKEECKKKKRLLRDKEEIVTSKDENGVFAWLFANSVLPEA